MQYADEETTVKVSSLKCLINTSMQVEVPKVSTKPADDGLECIFKMRTKLYRFSDNQWKERGIGNLKMLRDRKERKIRVLLRQEKTYKPVANFLCKSD